jgi:hypothetical protein
MTGLDVGTFPVMSTHLLGEMGGLAAAGWLKIQTHHGEFSPAFFFEAAKLQTRRERRKPTNQL